MGKLQLDNNLLNSYKAFAGSHFLLNVVNSIQSDLLLKKTQDAFMTLQKYNKLNKYALRASNVNLTSLADEIEFLQTYLSLEHMRFHGNFAKSVSTTNISEGDLVPSFILQSLTENAVLLSLEEESGKCRFECRVEDEFIHFIIRLAQDINHTHHQKVKHKTELAEKRLALLKDADILTYELTWHEDAFMHLKLKIHDI